MNARQKMEDAVMNVSILLGVTNACVPKVSKCTWTTLPVQVEFFRTFVDGYQHYKMSTTLC